MFVVLKQLHGIQAHLDAVFGGENVEDRDRLIAGSNELSSADKWLWRNFLHSFCHYGALEPLQGTTLDLGSGVTLRLNRRHEDLEGNELPGARVDGHGDLVIEGDFYRDGIPCARSDPRRAPRWPLIIRDAPIIGSGPWINFRPQTFDMLRSIGEMWPLAGKRVA